MGKCRFTREKFSLYNKTLNYSYLIFVLCCGLIGTLLKTPDTAILLVMLMVVYFIIMIYTLGLHIYKLYYIKNGRSSKGKIVKELVTDTTNIIFFIEYKNPYTKEKIQIKSGRVTNSLNSLKSNEVTIYTLEDGRYFITDLDN